MSNHDLSLRTVEGCGFWNDSSNSSDGFYSVEPRRQMVWVSYEQGIVDSGTNCCGLPLFMLWQQSTSEALRPASEIDELKYGSHLRRKYRNRQAASHLLGTVKKARACWEGSTSANHFNYPWYTILFTILRSRSNSNKHGSGVDQ